jgi:hypothetical protein
MSGPDAQSVGSVKVVAKGLIKAVPSAGTRQALSSSVLWARGVVLAAPAANAGVVYFGDVTVSNSAGFVIAPGATVSLKDLTGWGDLTVDLSRQYIDVATSGDKLSVLYFVMVTH